LKEKYYFEKQNIALVVSIGKIEILAEKKTHKKVD